MVVRLHSGRPLTNQGNKEDRTSRRANLARSPVRRTTVTAPRPPPLKRCPSPGGPPQRSQQLKRQESRLPELLLTVVDNKPKLDQLASLAEEGSLAWGSAKSNYRAVSASREISSGHPSWYSSVFVIRPAVLYSVNLSRNSLGSFACMQRHAVRLGTRGGTLGCCGRGGNSDSVLSLCWSSSVLPDLRERRRCCDAAQLLIVERGRRGVGNLNLTLRTVQERGRHGRGRRHGFGSTLRRHLSQLEPLELPSAMRLHFLQFCTQKQEHLFYSTAHTAQYSTEGGAHAGYRHRMCSDVPAAWPRTTCCPE